MKKETKIMSFVIVAVAALCLLSVTAAAPIAATAAPLSKATGAKIGATQSPYTLTLTTPSTNWKVGEWNDISGSLTPAIGNVTINIQERESSASQWNTIGNVGTTDSDGSYAGQLKPGSAGEFYFRATCSYATSDYIQVEVS